MPTELFITACGYVDETGFGNARFRRAWARPEDAADLRWGLISEAPNDRFGRLDALSKYAVAAGEMLDLPPAGDGGRPTMARAGGKDAEKLPEALATAKAMILEALS